MAGILPAAITAVRGSPQDNMHHMHQRGEEIIGVTRKHRRKARLSKADAVLWKSLHADKLVGGHVQAVGFALYNGAMVQACQPPSMLLAHEFSQCESASLGRSLGALLAEYFSAVIKCINKSGSIGAVGNSAVPTEMAMMASVHQPYAACRTSTCCIWSHTKHRLHLYIPIRRTICLYWISLLVYTSCPARAGFCSG